ncbi:hypothetical protein C0584_05385 [Candidatus Parcubacteria bacterium]|nr:MAG: hypothetical protein C0584_05385 [Candidatus Parcubacteria bacterium]
MNKKELSQKVLESIKKHKIIPKPKWTFLLRNYVVWFAGLISLVIGALALSVIIYMLRYNGWEEYHYISDSIPQFILLTLPYFWIVFLIIFVLVADYYIRHTNKGYRYRLPVVVLISVFASVLLGGIFYKIGMGQAIDDILGSRAPFYKEIINRKPLFWNNPEKGYLTGQVMGIVSDAEFNFRDAENVDWLIVYNKEEIFRMPKLENNMKISLIGNILSNNIFEAKDFRPLRPGGAFLERGMMGRGMHMMEDPERKMQKIDEMRRIIEERPEMGEFLKTFLDGHATSSEGQFGRELMMFLERHGTSSEPILER